jgi:hypothetical protein
VGRVAADVDDGPAVGQHRQQRLGQEVRPLEQDPHELVEQFLGGVFEHRHPAEAGVVDQVVERVPLPGVAQRGEDLLAEGREGFAAAHVQPQRDGGAALLLDGGHRVLRAGLVAAVGQDDVCPTLGELDGCALPDAGAGADDDRDPHGSTYLFIHGAAVCSLRLGCIHLTIATR